MNVALATKEKAHPSVRTLPPRPAARLVPVEPFVTVEGRALAKVMKLMTAVVERRNTYPILGTVRLSVKGSVLTVAGTDLDMTATSEIDVIDAAGRWERCMDCRTLASIARVAGAMRLRIEPGEKVAKIVLGDNDASYEIDTLDAAAFPEIGGDAGKKRGALIESFEPGSLPAMLGKVVGCMSAEETRYYLNGVAWQQGSKGRRVVATDGHRMAVCRYHGDEFGDLKLTRLIPRKAVSVLRRFLGAAGVSIHAVSETAIDIVVPGTVIRTKLIEGQFPDIDRVVPRAQRFHFEINPIELLAALARVAAIFGRDDRAIHFHPVNGRIAIKAKRADVGSSLCCLGASWAMAEKVPASEFGVNLQYLRDLIGQAHGNVVIHQVDPSAPITITDDDATTFRLIMPMRV